MANKNTGKRAAKQAEKTVRKLPLSARLIIALVIVAALAVSLFFAQNINYALGLKSVSESAYDGDSTQKVLNGSGGSLNLHFVDVGQGDACIIELPDGRTMLIDSGERDSDDTLIKYIEANIKDDEGKAVTGFDFAVLTHSDSDHCGEMKDVLTRFPADTFYRPNQQATYKGYADPGTADLYGDYSGKDTMKYKEAIEAGYAGAKVTYATDATDSEQNKITPENLTAENEGYYEINFYSPVKDRYSDYNDYSPIIILEYEDNRVALSGDAEKAAEADFVANATAQNKTDRFSVFDDAFTVQAIKLGHHGSSTSSSEQYLEVLTTDVSRKDVRIIISCGLNNKYNHPHTQVLVRLEEMGFSRDNILRTDENGDIAMSIKFDEASGKYALFVGADVVRTQNSVSVGAVDVTWTQIAVVLMIITVAVFIVIPAIYDMKRKAGKRR